MAHLVETEVLIVGGGLAGIVSALECLRAGKRVVLVDAQEPEQLGGLARWAFGGMALVGTRLQARLKIHDTPEIALQDWIRFGELAQEDVLARQWAQYYVQNSNVMVYEWLRKEGIRFMPAVNWVERGRYGEGNSLPRYHVVWGTSRELVRCLIAAMHQSDKGRLTVLHRHRIVKLDNSAGTVTGAVAVDETTGQEVRIGASVVILAMGGINGSSESVKAHWPEDQPMPSSMLNGAHPSSDGRLHHWVEEYMQGQLSRAGAMWNYASGFAHPNPRFSGHGLSTIPCKSALWLNHRGERIGPEPLITGFDTHWLCRQVSAQEKPYTWMLMNWRIAVKEFAISGAEHNQRIRDKQFLRFAAETMLGNDRLVRQMQQESAHFLVDASLSGLVGKMNALAGTDDVHLSVLQAAVDAFDANFKRGLKVHNDDQIRRIVHLRQWGPERLRTCAPAPLQSKGAGPFIALQTQLITRKSLGGLRTDVHSRVLNRQGEYIPGLYCVGEAAGFGGGGACGKRSLEGTFLPGCILTARAAVHSVVDGFSY